MPVTLQILQTVGFNPIGKSNIREEWSNLHKFKDRDHAQSFLELNWDLKCPLENTNRWRVVEEMNWGMKGE